MDLVHKLFHGLVWFVSDRFKEFLLEPIRLFEGILLCIFDQGAALELGLDSAHGGCEAVVAIVAISVATFGVVAFGKTQIGGAGLFPCQMAVLPSPRAVGPDASLVFCR
jgi:hypothetical protein